MTSSTKPELYNVSYIALTEEDRATAIGNMHRNLVKTGNDRGQTDRCVVPLIHSTVPPAESVINTNGTDQYTVNTIDGVRKARVGVRVSCSDVTVINDRQSPPSAPMQLANQLHLKTCDR